MVTKIKYLGLLSILSMTSLCQLHAASKIDGTWQTQKPDKNARIKIESCTTHKDYKMLINAEPDRDATNDVLSTMLCGRITWLSDPVYPEGDQEAGKPKVDRNNTNESLQSRPLMNLPILYGFTSDSDTKYSGGFIYNPEDGQSYKCNMTLNDANNLEVHGFIEILSIPVGKTQLWKRVKD